MHRLNRSTTRVLAGALLLAIAGPLYAQQDKQAGAKDAKQAQQQGKPPAKPQSEAAGNDVAGKDKGDAQDQGASQNPGDFIPTEEISEDLSVSFPIDI